MNRYLIALALLLVVPKVCLPDDPEPGKNTYWVVLRTGDVRRAGTNADVDIRLSGEEGVSSWITLDEQGDDREQGDVNIYTIDIQNIGDVQTVSIRAREESARPSGPGWFLDSVLLRVAPVPAALTDMLESTDRTKQECRAAFAAALEKAPGTKVFRYAGWVAPGKFSNRNTVSEWKVLELTAALAAAPADVSRGTSK